MVTREIQSVIDTTEEYVVLWKHLAELASVQHKAVGHWQAMLSGSGFFPMGSHLAPSSLSQNINPWNISLFQVISGTRGDPKTEVEIVTQVASYGSQLGTVIDALIAILPDDAQQKQLNVKEPDAIEKLRKLASEIKGIKGIKDIKG